MLLNKGVWVKAKEQLMCSCSRITHKRECWDTELPPALSYEDELLWQEQELSVSKTQQTSCLPKSNAADTFALGRLHRPNAVFLTSCPFSYNPPPSQIHFRTFQSKDFPYFRLNDQHKVLQRSIGIKLVMPDMKICISFLLLDNPDLS